MNMTRLTLSVIEIYPTLKVLEVIASTEKPFLSTVLEKEISNSSSKTSSFETFLLIETSEPVKY